VTFATQLQPYFAAAQQLLQFSEMRQTAIAEDQFLSAVTSFRAAVDATLLPEMPAVRLAQLDEEIRRLDGFPVQGLLYFEVARSFVRKLRELNFLPATQKKESARQRYLRLIGLEVHDPGDSMVASSGQLFDRKRTRRGIGVSESMFIGGMAVPTSMGRPTIRRTLLDERDPTTLPKAIAGKPIVDVVEAPAPKEPDAVINPFTGELMVAGRLWVRSIIKENDQYVEKSGRSPYFLTGLIGQGGTSNVYLAREDGTKRELALKIVNNAKTPQEQEVIFKGFLKEQELSGSEERDRSVTVYGTGHTATGFPYIAMEYLSGGSLYERSNAIAFGESRFDLSESVSLCAQVVAAVAEAHRDGIVHLDIKPENFFLSRDRKKAKLGDYGLAERAQAIENSVTDAIFGTVGYVPPENCPSKAPTPIGTQKRDVWALGVTLYEMLTGVFPFEAPTYQVMFAKMVMPLKPPSQIRKEIPSVLDQVVMKALSSDPATRYADAEEMLFDLVSYKARAEEEEAKKIYQDIETIDAGIKQTDEAQAYLLRRRIRILRASWRNHLEGALREYGRLFDEYDSVSMRDKMIELNLDLHRWADVSGDDEAVRHRSARILNLAPADSPAVAEVSSPIHVDLYLDGKRPRGAEPKYTIAMSQSLEGSIEFKRFLAPNEIKRTDERPGTRGFDLVRGAVYGVRFTANGAVPVFIPLPVRPGGHSVRIPIYHLSEVPGRYVVIPAGPVAARQGPGSYSEQFDVWRVVDHDYAMGPLVTNEEYAHYLEWVASQFNRREAAARTPRNWRTSRVGGYVYEDGMQILQNGPVTHISYQNALDYLKHLSGELGMTVRLPTLNEWKRAMRGNDARLWSWGDAAPDLGLAAFRYPAPGGSGAVVASPVDDPNIRDISPFSVPDLENPEGQRIIRHVAGNVQKFLDFGTLNERALIAQALKMSVQDLTSKYFLAAGDPYDGPAPSNPDILRRKEYNDIIPAGIFPVIELRQALPTPAPGSLAPSQAPS